MNPKKTVVLGITGGIAAYRSVDIARMLTLKGYKVKAVMTEAATRFVTALTFRTVTRQPVSVDLFDDNTESPMHHLSLSDEADIILIAPATADFLAKLTYGIADDLLSTVVLAARGPVYVAPAMNERMWCNPATKENVETLSARGIRMIGPAEGRLAEGTGIGRMADVDDIIQEVIRALKQTDELKGKRIVVTAGGTREPIDAVRFLANASSGKMGYALAEEAAARGAEVTLISGPSNLRASAGVSLVSVKTAADMDREVSKIFPHTDMLIMAAAVADIRPKKSERKKIKKHDLADIEIEKTEDILLRLGKAKTKQKLIGFAAETDDLETRAKDKLKVKNLDMIVANDVNGSDTGMESDYNRVIIITRDNKRIQTERLKKKVLAGVILDHIRELC